MAEASLFTLSQERTTHQDAFPIPGPHIQSKLPDQVQKESPACQFTSGVELTLHRGLVDLAVLRQPLGLRLLATQRAVHGIPQVELGGRVSTVALPASEDGQGELLPGRRKRCVSNEW